VPTVNLLISIDLHLCELNSLAQKCDQTHFFGDFVIRVELFYYVEIVNFEN